MYSSVLVFSVLVAVSAPSLVLAQESQEGQESQESQESQTPSVDAVQAPAPPSSPEGAEPAEPSEAREESATAATTTTENAETGTDVDAETSPELALSAEDLAALTAATVADEEQREDEGQHGQDSPITDPTSGEGSLGTQGSRRQAGVFQSFNPDLSFILDVAFGWFSDESNNLQTGAHDPVKNGFNLQQLELSVSAAVDPYFRVDGNIVFGEFGVEIEEFYGTTLALPALLQARVGQFLTRFGRANNTHPHSWDFVDQPFAIGRVMGAEGNRGLGLEVSWLTPLPWFVEVLGSASDASGEATARSFYGANDLGVRTPADFQYTVAAKSFHPLSDDWSFFWGLSGAFGPNGTGRSNRSEVYGADTFLKWRPISRQSFQEVTLTAEAFYRRRQIPDDVLSDWSMYASLYWRMAMRWAVAARYELGTPARGTDGAPSQSDYLDPEWTENRHRATANVSFWPTEFSRIRVQGSVDIPEWRDEAVWAGFVAMEFVTGAHGAHSF